MPFDMSYAEKLKDPRWQKVRLKILSRDKWKCRMCKCADKMLSVHHLFYYGNPWDMDKKWLITVDYERIYRRLNKNRLRDKTEK